MGGRKIDHRNSKREMTTKSSTWQTDHDSRQRIEMTTKFFRDGNTLITDVKLPGLVFN